ncbi:MHYT domain-containing protein [Herbaspirillum lusitanum]|uniref:MHYT domain-containing protein n=1 Tax=Herbaspirillum lusitanum TaxID=213312 RepID=UPI001EE64976|nr:MHYT domain-containing protein [Herbaspirillum lusitanum]
MHDMSSFFMASSHHGSLVHGSYDGALVLLSLFVSIFSSTMALQSAQIARRTKNRLYRHTAIATGAVALGGGIWTMHFIGMLAFELPTHVHYETRVTLFSLIPACAASWFALHRLVQHNISKLQLVTSGTIVGAGIGAMHYTGMAAMQTPLQMRYEPVTFAVSIVVAVTLATLALWIRYGVQQTSLNRIQRFYVSGIVMGLAIAGMHYTGMAAVRFIGEPGIAGNGLLLSTAFASLGLSSFTITVTVMVAALNGLIRSRELYQEVDEHRSRLKATLETTVDGIITIDSKGLIQAFNPAAERLFGWRADEVIGRNITVLMPEPDRSGHDGYLKKHVTSGQPDIAGTSREVMGLRRSGEHIPLRLAVGQVLLSDEMLFVGFVTDISERHALEASLRETAERANHAAAAKSSFLANMSHEIRTPMNSIIGFTELLLQSDLTPAQRDHLNTVRQSSRSLLRLINDILDTTKMEKGHLDLEETVFSLRAMSMQVESSLRLSAHAKNLTLTTHYGADTPDYFRGDPLRLLQILTNLIGNAIKFTEQGGVDVLFGLENEMIHVQVRDTGIGMTQQQAESIFSPFTQADASISRRFGGTGLGTTIARQLAELMGGRIEVVSEPGRGSTFHVWLSLPQANAPENTHPAKANCRALPALRILAADDVAQNLELLSLVLESQGHSVTLARDGAEAVQKFKEGSFDVALMDVHMPVIDGLQATQLIRQHERTLGLRRMPVIALTASVMTEDRRAALQAGMDGFAIKPLDVPRLFEEIAIVLDIPEQAEAPSRELPATPLASPVVDWNRGATLWGNEGRLMLSLQQLLETAAERYPLLAAEAEDIDWEASLLSLHSLRGVAGNLALPVVSKLAGDMEAKMKSAQHAEARALLPQLRDSIEAVRHEVSKRHAAEVPTPASSPEDLLVSLHALRKALARNELADDMLDRACSGLENRQQRAQAQSLRSATESFEFRQAHALVEKLIAEHGNPNEKK